MKLEFHDVRHSRRMAFQLADTPEFEFALVSDSGGYLPEYRARLEVEVIDKGAVVRKAALLSSNGDFHCVLAH